MVFTYFIKTKNTHLSPVDSAFLEAGLEVSAENEVYSAGRYKRLSLSRAKTNLTNLRAVNASTRLCWYLFASLYLRW